MKSRSEAMARPDLDLGIMPVPLRLPEEKECCWAAVTAMAVNKFRNDSAENVQTVLKKVPRPRPDGPYDVGAALECYGYGTWSKDLYPDNPVPTVTRELVLQELQDHHRLVALTFGTDVDEQHVVLVGGLFLDKALFLVDPGGYACNYNGAKHWYELTECSGVICICDNAWFLRK
jgi:hypothetical protein